MGTVIRMFGRLAVYLFVLLWLPGNGFANVSGITPFVRDAMKVLALEKGSEDLGVLTNARYVRLGGKTTEQYLSAIETLTACSIGKGNLLFFNERPENSLLIALANRKTKEAIVIRYDGNQGKSKFLSLRDVNIQDPEFFFNATLGASGKETFHIVTILSAWFAHAPYDFQQCAELHGHLCPGVFFGYYTAKGLLERYPLLEGEKYIFIASPNECKDDAIQAVLGLTPGKRNIIVKPVHKKQIEKKEGVILTGIMIKWSEIKHKGLGLVLGVDSDAIQAVTKVDQQMPRNMKILAVRKLLEHLDDSADFFTVEREFPVSKELKEQLTQAGTNPYVVLGMMPAASNKK